MTFSEIYRDYPEHHEEFDELAGKFEFDANMEREAAEAETAHIMMKRHLLFIQGTLFKGRGY